MKTVQSEGPYRLSGFSFGATVAIEMALQLEDANAVVENLILLDGSHKIIPNNLVGKFLSGMDAICDNQSPKHFFHS